MWDASASDILVAFRAALVASDDFASLIGGESKVHFPAFNLRTDGVPACLIEESDYLADRHAAGLSYGAWTLTAVLYVPMTTTLGLLEARGKAICDDLVCWTGADSLCILRARRGRAMEPSEAQRAAANDSGAAVAYRTCSIVAEVEG